MTLDMKLYDDPFEQIKNGTKKIELRLFDEKRANLKLGDNIVFDRVNDPQDTVTVKVTGLLRYNTFEELFNDINMDLVAISGSLAEKLEVVHRIYSWEREQEYGVLGIHVELV